MQEPEEIILGSPYYNQRFTGQLSHSFHYISILESLRALLNDTSVFQLSNSRVRFDGVLGGFCDGQLFRANPLFNSMTSAIQIIAYYDELEICNPLRSYVKKQAWRCLLFSGKYSS